MLIHPEIFNTRLFRGRLFYGKLFRGTVFDKAKLYTYMVSVTSSPIVINSTDNIKVISKGHDGNIIFD